MKVLAFQSFSLEAQFRLLNSCCIRPLKVSPLNHPERAPKSWGFFAYEKEEAE